ncbi:MAG: DUF2071 domain-containing protein [Gemmataceae bacterium]|nr:DUF2071 domain-containing protein [Gemmataceae bacterium]MCI0739936.1 DUF2071 domain-containing protein [Gemmataceae bacterium]
MWGARRFYNENYIALSMRHVVAPPQNGEVGAFRYDWHFGGRWNGVWADVTGRPQAKIPGSEEEFIAEHYFGYTRQKDGSTVEYQVQHPPWRVWNTVDAGLDCDIAQLYGERFVPILRAKPTSAFVADGSAVRVRRGQTVWRPGQSLL